jgi:hypothetical protein
MPVRLAAAGALMAHTAKLVIKLKNDQPARLMGFTLQGERLGRKRFVTVNTHFCAPVAFSWANTTHRFGLCVVGP